MVAFNLLRTKGGAAIHCVINQSQIGSRVLFKDWFPIPNRENEMTDIGQRNPARSTTSSPAVATGMPARVKRKSVATGAAATGATATGAVGIGGLGLVAAGLGALAIGAIAVGAVVIGRLTIRNARIRKLRIDELEVGRLIYRNDDGGPSEPWKTIERV